MARRKQKMIKGYPLRRTLAAMARSAFRVGSKALGQALKAAPATARTAKPKRSAIKLKREPAADGSWSIGNAIGVAGAYRLYRPAGIKRNERLPLLVMLHGCLQDGEAIAASSRMNRIAASERFLVLYPDQDRLSNVQRCWNWYETRSGHAQLEATLIEAVINQVCRLHAVDHDCIALAGFSAGAAMAALLAIRQPERFLAIAMHSGIAPGVATSSATALSAMRGHIAPSPLAQVAAGTQFPALLVIHGGADHIVAPSNGAEAALLWADRVGAVPSVPRIIQRGGRHAMTITDYRSGGDLIATLCDVKGLGHAWSGGTKGLDYSDPKGPDASRMIWTFVAKQLASACRRVEPTVVERPIFAVPALSADRSELR